ncbi:hypothetical protein LINPERHAP1_LOCUS34601 [Linum perenne]
MEEQLRKLAILEDEGDIAVPDFLEDALIEDLSLFLVGSLLTDRAYNFNAMRLTMVNLWKPSRGITIEDRGEGLILFRFYHPIDLQSVMELSPWTSDQSLLILHAMQPGEDSTTVSLHKAEFLVHICGLTAEFYSEVAGRAVDVFLGEFVQYDECNILSLTRPYMCIMAEIVKLRDETLHAPERCLLMLIGNCWLIPSEEERRRNELKVGRDGKKLGSWHSGTTASA